MLHLVIVCAVCGQTDFAGETTARGEVWEGNGMTKRAAAASVAVCAASLSTFTVHHNKGLHVAVMSSFANLRSSVKAVYERLREDDDLDDEEDSVLDVSENQDGGRERKPTRWWEYAPLCGEQDTFYSLMVD